MDNHADLFHANGDFDKAENMYREAIAIYERIPGAGAEKYTASPTLGLGRVLLAMERMDEAESWLRRGLDIWERTSSEDDKLMARALMFLGQCLLKSGKYTEAEEKLLQAHERAVARYDHNHERVHKVAELLR